MYVVSVIKNGAGSDVKSFARQSDAVLMAQAAVKTDADRAMIYATPDVTDPVKAVDAAQSGDAMVMDMISRNGFEESTSKIVGALQDLVDKNAATKAAQPSETSVSVGAPDPAASGSALPAPRPVLSA